MIEEKSTHKGLAFVVLVAVVSLLPTVSGQDPPVDDDQAENGQDQKECLFYAYTSSENHRFLLGPNTSMFGERLMVVHNCQEVSIYINGFFEASSGSNFSIVVENGIHNITLESNSTQITFQNVVFYPERLDWEFDYQFIQESKPQFIDLETSKTQANWAVFVGIIIVWVLNVYVYWTLISSYVDRNFIEEVVQ